MKLNRIFIGVDRRQPVAYNVLQWSLQWSAKRPIVVQPILLHQLPAGVPRGLTEFSLSRYLVPWLCDFKGRALFMDADMLIRHGVDINDLFDELADVDFDVAVNKQLPRFEWASMMMFDCPAWSHITPDTLAQNGQPFSGKVIHGFDPSWNVMTLVNSPPSEIEGARVLHFTQGLPCLYETRDTPGASDWTAIKRHMLHSVSWQTLLGKSVHARPVLEHMISRYVTK